MRGQSMKPPQRSGHRHFFNEREFLVNHRQSGFLRVFDCGEFCFFSIHIEASFIAAMGMNAGEQFDQRALACAVLTTQRMDLTFAKVKGDILERGDSWETFGDVLCTKNHGLGD
jgi:hypothetical protein